MKFGSVGMLSLLICNGLMNHKDSSVNLEGKLNLLLYNLYILLMRIVNKDLLSHLLCNCLQSRRLDKLTS